MSENNIEQVQANVETNTSAVKTTAAPGRKVRIGYIFLAVVPVAALIMIQSICQLPFFVMASLELAGNGGLPDSAMDFTDQVMKIFTDKYAFYSYLAYAAIAIIVFAIWYYNGFVKKAPKLKLGQIFGFKSILAAIGTVVGLNFSISAGFTIAYWIFPDVMDAYAKLVEQAGLGSNFLITLIYVIFLGPVVEELCVRGLCFGYLEKSNIKPFFMILISGILFGVMHMNLVQGIYASILGFFLGFLRYKYRSILIPLFTHILFNLMGTYGDVALQNIGMNDGFVLILGGLSLFVLVFVVVLVNGDKKAVKAAE
ncbi:MAG: CPBP family intramembrane metalloprotease [Clostridiales bacterium]|nr:CPBP family intramembrane metalloprotease [Clostridiales bacterium]